MYSRLLAIGLAAALGGCSLHHPYGAEDYAGLLEAPAGPRAGELVLTFFEVVHGDAYLVEFPNGRRLLVDGGFSSCPHQIFEYFEARGIESLDAVLLTHPHWDHYGGLAEVVRRVPVGVFLSNGECDGIGPWGRLDETLGERGVARRSLRRGDRLDDLSGPDVSIEVLLPDSAALAQGGNHNRGSIVLSLEHGENRFLMTGDAEAPEESRLLELEGPRLEADVLKLGHHASRGSGTEAFLRAVRPRVAVAQGTAFANVPFVYPRPSPGIRRALGEIGTRLMTVDDEGAIQIASDGRALRVATMAAR